MSKRFTALDLFCGLGGWSEGFHLEGFDVLGVDIVNPGYRFDMILQDVRTIDPMRFKDRFDVVVGSPPCKHFSNLSYLSDSWNVKPSIDKGLELVYSFLDFVKIVDPPIWIMENIPKLTKYLELKERCIVPIAKNFKRALWGNFPAFLIPQTTKMGYYDKIPGLNRIIQVGKTGRHYRSWVYAKIPLVVARAFGRVCYDALVNS